MPSWLLSLAPTIWAVQQSDPWQSCRLASDPEAHPLRPEGHQKRSSTCFSVPWPNRKAIASRPERPWLRQPSPCFEVPLTHPAFCIILVCWVAHGTREGRTTTTIAGLDTNTGVTCMFRATQHNAGKPKQFLSSRLQGGSVQSQKITKTTSGQNRLPLPKGRDVVLAPTKG